MKSLFTLISLSLGLALNAQSFNPFFLLNLELIADNQIVPYERVVLLDPLIQPPDSLGDLRISRSFTGEFTNGYELVYPFKDTARWVCTVQGGMNEIAVLDPQNPNDTLQKDKIYKNAMGNDTAMYSYYPAPNGSLTLFQSLSIKSDSQGLSDSIFVYDHMGGLRSLFAVLTPKRNANGQTDTLLVQADIGSGTLTPVQLFTYRHNQNRLDSVLIFDLFTSPTLPVEVFTMTHNANNQITRITVSERNSSNGEYDPYETYFFFPRADLTRTEHSTAKVQVFPNPASDFIQIKLKDQATVTVLNSTGSILKEWQNKKGTDQLPIDDLASGTYLMHIKIGSAIQKMKLIKD